MWACISVGASGAAQRYHTEINRQARKCLPVPAPPNLSSKTSLGGTAPPLPVGHFLLPASAPSVIFSPYGNIAEMLTISSRISA